VIATIAVRTLMSSAQLRARFARSWGNAGADDRTQQGQNDQDGSR
jgi:hypothetical protein